DSIEIAFRHGDGIALVEVAESGAETAVPELFSQRHACAVCGVSFPELAPRFFSFNSPQGACPACGGLGVERRFDPGLIVPDPDKPAGQAFAGSVGRALPGLDESLLALSSHYRFAATTPWKELPDAVR